MRKKIVFIFLMMLFCICTGCYSNGDVKVYDDTEETVVSHEEKSMTAVLLSVDMEHNIVGVMDCLTGGTNSLIYHGGVKVTDSYGTDISIESMKAGMLVDVVYYSDTAKLVSISVSTSAEVRKSINKFSADVDAGKATYKGTSCAMSEYVKAFDGDTLIDISEINNEDQVTLYLYSGKLVSVVIELGHGYVRLNHQDTYVGGMVEIGYDVIVPVTADMLLTVREGSYVLRINKGGYSASKEVTVTRGKEIEVNLLDIAIPSGSAAFEVTPPEAVIYVSGNQIEGNVYTGLYGSYGIKVEADGYKTFRGSFTIDEAVETFKINLTALEDDTEDTTESSDDASSEETSSSDSQSSESDSQTTESDSQTTTEANITGNKITVKAPVGAGVYFDGDYVGVAPVSFPKVSGTHTITLYKTGFLIKSYTIQTTDNGKDDEYSYPALTSLLDLVE